jgi:hypothetical protein
VWGVVLVLYPYHLENLAYALGLTLVCGTMVAPIHHAIRVASDPLRRREFRSGRLASVAAFVLIAAIVLGAWPVNYYVRAPLVLLPVDAARVYATVDGTLLTALPAGHRVAAHDTVATFENPEISRELTRLAGEHRLASVRLENLERLRGRDPKASAEIPAARAHLADIANRLEDRRRDAERLKLFAPTEGVVIPLPEVERGSSNAGRLPHWSGGILDERNRGARVEPGTLVCLVGDPTSLSAVLLVDDNDVARLSAGQTARIVLEQAPGQIVSGEVLDVARRDAERMDSAMMARADLAPLFAGLVPKGRSETHYQVRVRLDGTDRPLAIGGRGEAKIAAERITFARWLARYFAQSFRLPS